MNVRNVVRVIESLFLAASPALAQTTPSAAAQAAKPCLTSAEHRRFDFWIGEWDVTPTLKPPAGPPSQSRITSIEDGCVILESYRTAGGYSGKSFNAYHPVKKRWEQFWVDNKGQVHHYAGNFRDGNLYYEAEGVRSGGPSSAPARARMTFFNHGPDQVRQLGESSTDEGKTWTVSYDLTYRRKKSDAEAQACATPQSPSDVAAVRATATGIVEADNQRALDRVLDFYADDAILLPPGEAAVAGKPKIRPRYESLFAGFDPKIVGRIDQVCASGATAFVRGWNGGRMAAHDGGKDRALDGTYLMLLRRDADQKWRISHLIWH